MPTVAQEGPWRFFFYSHEGTEPAHIHVAREQREAKFWLEPVALASNGGFAAHELRELQRVIESRKQTFLEAWHGYFGYQS